MSVAGTAMVFSNTLVLGGFDTGLVAPLLAPSFFGALWSLRRSPEASAYDKALRVVASTLFGAWGGYPVAVAVTGAIPKIVVRGLSGFDAVSPEALMFLIAGLIGYAGLALVDRWLFPQRAARVGDE